MKLRVSKSLQAIADIIGARLKGDPNCQISNIASLESAKEGELSFLSNKQYRKYLESTKASAVIVSPEDADLCPVNALITDNARLALAKVAKIFELVEPAPKGVHPTATIGDNCQIPSSASIGPNVVLGNHVTLGEEVVIGAGCVIGSECVLGDRSSLKSNVTLYDNVRLGSQCLIHSGTVIGSDGFGFAMHEGAWVKIPHIGGVSIGNKVEIGSNTSIDRGFLEDTTIGDGVIIDNLVQIGHNVTIGANTAIAGCVAIAGSTSIGQSCQIGGASSIAGHINIADKVFITATSGVNHSLNTPGIYSSGFPAKPAHQWRKNVARFNFLDDMAKRVRSLSKAQNLTNSTENE